MGYNGRWASQARYDPVPHAVRTVDPVHADTAAGVDPVDAVPAPPPPDYGDIGEMPWADWFVLDTMGTEPVDPSQDHNVDADHGRRDAPLNETIMGASADASDEVYQQDIVPEMPVYAGGGPGMPRYGEVRGYRLARAESNPEGDIRGGQQIYRWWADRDRTVRAGIRRTDVRVTTVPSVWTPPVGTDTVPDQPGRYSSPFDAWARGLNGGPAMPQVRRVPPPIDESVQSDGTAEADSEVYGGWVL